MTRVIKVGGRPQLDPDLITALANAHRATFPAPTQPHTGMPNGLVVVHGGGDEVSMLQRLYGLKAEFKGGRRVTSALDLEIIRMALSGSANKRLVSALVSAQVPAIGLSGEDAALLTASPLDCEQFGFVGVPVHVNTGLLAQLLGSFFLPVISPVSRCDDPRIGATLNVNGDDAAAAIAVALQADELLLVSDVAGVMKDNALVSALALDDAHRLIDDGTAQGGMAAKLQAAIAALEGGVERVRISDIAAIEQLERGTVLTRVGSVCA
ncbi:MAG: acetylglutamate kinase [bacterium]